MLLANSTPTHAGTAAEMLTFWSSAQAGAHQATPPHCTNRSEHRSRLFPAEPLQYRDGQLPSGPFYALPQQDERRTAETDAFSELLRLTPSNRRATLLLLQQHELQSPSAASRYPSPSRSAALMCDLMTVRLMHTLCTAGVRGVRLGHIAGMQM